MGWGLAKGRVSGILGVGEESRACHYLEKRETILNLGGISTGELLLLIPVILLELGLLIVALVDLIRRQKTRGPKWLWALVILFIQIIGPILYLIAGRETE